MQTHCKSCGAPVDLDSRYCAYCGVPYDTTKNYPKPRKIQDNLSDVSIVCFSCNSYFPAKQLEYCNIISAPGCAIEMDWSYQCPNCRLRFNGTSYLEMVLKDKSIKKSNTVRVSCHVSAYRRLFYES